MVETRRISRLAIVLLLTFFFAGCPSPISPPPAADEPAADEPAPPAYPPPTTITQAVGSGGGTVSNPDGASVTIPPGALAADSAITVSCYSSSQGFVADHSAEVTHFTVYRSFPNYKDSFKGKFAQILAANGGDFSLAFGSFIAWFYEATTVILLVDRVVTDVGEYVLEQVFFSLRGKNPQGEFEKAFNDGSDNA
jgi:hypothetical protein